MLNNGSTGAGPEGEVQGVTTPDPWRWMSHTAPQSQLDASKSFAGLGANSGGVSFTHCVLLCECISPHTARKESLRLAKHVHKGSSDEEECRLVYLASRPCFTGEVKDGNKHREEGTASLA